MKRADILKLIITLSLFYPLICKGADSNVIGNGGDVVRIDENIVSPPSSSEVMGSKDFPHQLWEAICQNWKSLVKEDASKRQSRLLNIDCGKHQVGTTNSLDVGKGTILLQTDNFRGRLVQVENIISVDDTPYYYFSRFQYSFTPGNEYAYANNCAICTPIEEALKKHNDSITKFLGKCREWKHELTERFTDKNIVIASCGTLGQVQLDRTVYDPIFAVGKAIIAIDQ